VSSLPSESKNALTDLFVLLYILIRRNINMKLASTRKIPAGQCPPAKRIPARAPDSSKNIRRIFLVPDRRRMSDPIFPYFVI
jgi:hypothetical protein